MKNFLITMAAVPLLAIPFFAFAQDVGAGPFGGIVTGIQPCDTGLLLYVKTPLPNPLILPIMWLFGELPFPDHIVPHPGQYLLGMTAPVVIPCFIGPVPYGAGFPIIYHGDSL